MRVAEFVLDFVLLLVPLAFVYESRDSFVKFLLARSCNKLILQRPINLLHKVFWELSPANRAVPASFDNLQITLVAQEVLAGK